MFLSGVVKLASGDPSWRNLTALTFHYETQPLPTSLGWCAHQLPAWWHRGTCAAMFVVELAAPFLLFAPRRLRHTGASLLAALMIGVALTGNYTFFNLLAIALCLLCFDDAWWRRALSFRPIQALASRFATRAAPAPRWQQRATLPFAVFTVAFTLAQLLPLFRATSGAGIFGRIEAFVSPFRSFNTYGLFAVMTNPRPELIFEGSNDGVVWQPYELPHKPGALDRRPTWVAPHQPRLDWQLWFAALGSLEQNQWVLAVCEHLLRGTPQVLALFSDNPFRDAPPRYVRVVRYEFHFTDAATRAATGHWWRRTPIDYYLRSASLK